MRTESGLQKMKPALRPASRVRGLRPYSPPGSKVGAELLLDANEGDAPGESVVAALSEVTADELRRYADASSLEACIAARHGIKPERVVVTNGGDDAIDRICRAFVDIGSSVVSHTPSFEMIARSVQLAGGNHRSVEWFRGNFPKQALIEGIDDDTRLVALVSPNNPTGGGIPEADMLDVIKASAGVGAATMVDLAYVEFADDDPTARLLELPNVIIVRTLSKAFGLAGLRVGYAVASANCAEWLRTVGGPYPVSSPSLAVAARAFERAADRDGVVERVRSNRQQLQAMLEGCGWRPLPTQANFVLVEVSDAVEIQAALLGLGIRVRRFATDGILRNAIRITVPGTAADMDKLCGAITTVAQTGLGGDKQ